MEQRLADVGPAALRKIRTLHALGFDIVRRSRAVQDVLGEWDVRRRIEPLVPVRPRANTDVFAPYLEALGEVRLGLVAPAAVEARRDDVEGFAAMFERYRDGLRADGVDRSRRADLRRDRGAADRCRRSGARCRPSAGTSSSTSSRTSRPRSCSMLRLLAAPAYDVFGVGDDDQVIYGYAGADPEFLIDYDRYFPGAAHLQLEVNYRCPAGSSSRGDATCSRTTACASRRRSAPRSRAGDAALSQPTADPAEQLPGAAAVEQIQAWLDDGARAG